MTGRLFLGLGLAAMLHLVASLLIQFLWVDLWESLLLQLMLLSFSNKLVDQWESLLLQLMLLSFSNKLGDQWESLLLTV